LTDRLIESAAAIVESKLSEATWYLSQKPLFRVNHFIQMETDASKDNNNFLLLLILPIYAVIVGGAIDFSPLSNSNKKKVSPPAPL